MVCRRRWLGAALAAAGLVPLPAAAQAPGSALLGAMPDEAVAVAWADDPVRAVEALAAALSPVPAGLPPEVVLRIGAGLAALRLGLRGSVADTARVVAAGGVAVGLGVHPERGRLFVAARPGDLDAAQALLRRAAPRLHVAVVDGVLVASDAAAGLAAMQDARAPGAAGSARWAAARPCPPDEQDAVLHAVVDLARLRRLLPDGALAIERLDGPGRVLLLPVAHAAAHATTVVLRVAADAAGLRVSARGDASAHGSDYGPLFARGGTRRALVPLGDDGLVLVSLDRSLRALLAAPERFLPPAGVAGVAGFLSIADALDGARTSFVDDLLGGLAEPFVVHVTAPAADSDEDVGPLVLPEVAVAAAIADAGVESVLTRFSQVFATIANAERLQRGTGAFRLRRVDEDDARGFVAEPPPWRGPGAPPLDRQLSPTLLCGRGIAVLATTAGAARAVLDRCPTATEVAGDVVELRGPAIADLLARDRGPLVFARMLDEGEDGAQAERIVAGVEAVAAALRRVAIACEVDGASTVVRVVVERRR